MLNQLLGSEPSVLAAFGVALIVGVRSLRQRLQQSRQAPGTSRVPRVPQPATQFATLRKAA